MLKYKAGFESSVGVSKLIEAEVTYPSESPSPLPITAAE
jgi:hypothetical protein